MRLPRNLTGPAQEAVLRALRARAPGILHVVDPYKVPLAQAFEKARAVADLGHPALLVGSTDNPAFDSHVAPYVAELRERTDLRLILHFPPIRGRGAPLCAGADAVLMHTVLNATQAYFACEVTADTLREMTRFDKAAPEALRSASFAFGTDPKTRQAVASTPTVEDDAALAPLLDSVVAGDYHLAYLLSRHGRIPPEVCRIFRRRLAAHQLLFAGGGVRTHGQVREYRENGVDWVVVGNGMEEDDWRDILRGLYGVRRRRDGGPVPPRTAGSAALARQVQRGLSRPVRTDPVETRPYTTNVGGVCRQVPALVAHVRSADEVAHVLSTARAAGVPVGVRGAGHSFGPQALCDGGILMVNELGDPELSVHPDGTAEMSARTPWQAVETGLNARGRAMPVLTNHLTVSVGGTLSVGGYGEGTIAHGGQVDLVERFRLILPDGRPEWCSPGENPELFRYAIGSLGQLGVLDRVMLRTVPYTRTATTAIDRLPSLTALIDEVGWLAEADPAPVDFFSGQHYEGSFLATYGVRDDRPLPAYLRDRLTTRTEIDWCLRSLREQRRNPADPNVHFLWADYCLAWPAAGEFARFVEREVLLDPAYRRYHGRTLVLGAHRPERRAGVPFTPAASLRGLAIGFGLYFGVPRGDPSGVARVQALHRRALDVCLEWGGRPYLAGWYDLTEAEKQTLYGADLAALRRLRRQLDPANLLNPDLLA